VISTVSGVHGAVALILLLAGVVCLLGGAYRAWLRDFPAAVALVVVGIVLLALS
jgi:hypothetical protein